MRSSGATERNPALQDRSEKFREAGNLPFFGDALAELQGSGDGAGTMMAIGFVGSRDIPGVALRNAQSILRWDLRPSLWSHVFLVADGTGGGSDASAVAILEAPIFPRTGNFPQPERNGVQEGTLGLYADGELDANVALLAIRMTSDEAERVRRRAIDYNADRVRINLWELLGSWQGFVWANGQAANPLRDGFPIPSALYVEMAFEALALDLTPGASERNSSPEQIWTGAVWWHESFKEAQGRAISGSYVIRDRGCSLIDAKP